MMLWTTPSRRTKEGMRRGPIHHRVHARCGIADEKNNKRGQEKIGPHRRSSRVVADTSHSIQGFGLSSRTRSRNALPTKTSAPRSTIRNGKDTESSGTSTYHCIIYGSSLGMLEQCPSTCVRSRHMDTTEIMNTGNGSIEMEESRATTSRKKSNRTIWSLLTRKHGST